MTDAGGWTVSAQTHLSLNTFTSINGLSGTKQTKDVTVAGVEKKKQQRNAVKFGKF